jgi:hypothetical protein
MSTTSRIAGWYRKLVRLYPNPFRTEFGEDLVIVFEDIWRDSASKPAADRLRLLTFVAWDAIKSLLKEWADVLRWPDKVVLAGAALLLVMDVASHACSGIANAVYLWSSFAVAKFVFRRAERRHWSVPVMIAALIGPALYFGAIGLRAMPTFDAHARFGVGYDLAGLAVILVAVAAQVMSHAAEPDPAPAQRRWLGKRPYVGGLTVLLTIVCAICAVVGLIRFGALWRHDDTAVLLVIGNSLFSRFHAVWRRPVASP